MTYYPPPTNPTPTDPTTRSAAPSPRPPDPRPMSHVTPRHTTLHHIKMMMRRACIQTVIEHGFMRALSIQIGQNRTVNCWGQDNDNLTSHGWNVYVAGHNDVETSGYDSAAIEGRLLLRLAEAEAQLENFNMAAVYGKYGVREHVVDHGPLRFNR